jgi:hypothetical protein
MKVMKVDWRMPSLGRTGRIALFLLLPSAALALLALMFALRPFTARAQEADTDGDGMPDTWEIGFGLDPDDKTDADLDSDGDGLTNVEEHQLGTYPISPDSDGDGLLDLWEIKHGLNPVSGLRPDLAGWWRFTEKSGPAVNDWSGQKNDAEILDKEHVWRVTDAPIGGALRFDGIYDAACLGQGGYVRVASLSKTSLAKGITVAAWVRTDSFPSRVCPLIGRDDDDSWNDLLAIRFDRAATATSTAAARGTLFKTNVWTHLCLVNDGESTVLYANGVRTAVTTTATRSVAGTGPLWIGSVYGVANALLWHGDIADLRLYTGVLNGREVSDLLDPNADPDQDGLCNLGEQALGTDPDDPDSDNDGILDGSGVTYGFLRSWEDTDHDGMPDDWEAMFGLNPNYNDAYEDADSDGLCNIDEFIYNTCADEADTDNDGISDGWEVTYGLDPLDPFDTSADTDSDGLDYLEEYTNGTDPTNADSDGDGMPDGWEVYYGLDPLYYSDAWDDADSDNLYNVDEYTNDTDPTDDDTDGDGMEDGWEVYYLLDPLDPDDADDDADSDGLDNVNEYTNGSDPTDADSDEDGMPDGWEIAYGFDPLDPGDASGDADNDGLCNSQEYASGTYPTVVDSDGDGLLDAWECYYTLNPISGMRSDLIGWWRFAESNGTTVADWSGHGNDAGIIATQHVTRVDGTLLGSALRFDGAFDAAWLGQGGYVRVPGLTNAPLGGGFTVAAWVRADSFPSNASILVKSSDHGDWTNGFALYHEEGSSLSGYARNFGSAENRVNGGVASTNQWTHLCMVYDGQNTMLYTNASLLAVATNGVGSVTNSDAFWIGTTTDDQFARLWHGDIADVRFYAGALDSNAVAGMSDTYSDPDGDGLANIVEQTIGTNPTNSDSDGDGMPDGWEVYFGLDPLDPYDGSLDPDEDDLTNLEECTAGTNPNNADTDNDGMPDGWEVAHSLDPLDPDDAAADVDSDGLNNLGEFTAGTNPNNTDTDGDGMPDGWEVYYGLDPLDYSDAWGDLDSDNLYNLDEYTNNTYPDNPDSDGDGMPDNWEVTYSLNPLVDDTAGDADEDDLNNLEEYTLGTDPNNADSDNDGMPDHWEVTYNLNPLVDDTTGDADSDGLNNLGEYTNNTYPDDADTDNDGMPDNWEVTHGLDPLVDDTTGDADLDDLNNLGEYTAGTDPNNADSDNDGMPDNWEVTHNLDPLYPYDASGDGDSDGLDNLGEYTNDTDPTISDSDNDGMADGWEVTHGLDPLVDDTSGDADEDDLNNLEEYTAGTDPNNADSDNDGMPDGWEVTYNLNPLVDDTTADADVDDLSNLEEYTAGTNPNNADTDNDGMADHWEVTYNLNPLVDDATTDMDFDELSNLVEFTLGTDPTNNDTDGDDMPDKWEVTYNLNPLVDDATADPDLDELSNLEECTLGTDPNNADTDGDGMPDKWELTYGLDPLDYWDISGDTDNDGLTNLQEYQNGTYPISADSDGDGLLDAWECYYALNPISGMRSDLIGWWRFAESNGTTVVDWSGHGNDAGIIATQHVTRVAGTLLGSALQFDGEFDAAWLGQEGYVRVPGLTNALLGGGFTVAAWVRADSFPSNATILVKSSDHRDWTNGFALYHEDGSSLSGYARNYGSAENRVNGGVATTNQWMHLCMVYDGQHTTLYTNASLLAVATNGAGSVTNSDAFWIGTTTDDQCARLWHGDIADVRFYAAALDPNAVAGMSDTYSDPDGDGLANIAEQTIGTNPTNADSDGDGMPDHWEVTYGLNPLDYGDINGDADSDGLDNLGEYTNNTYPDDADTDNDGMFDGWEVTHGLDPLDPDDADDDTDQDGLNNLEEYTVGSDPNDDDTDDDGLSDGYEVNWRGITYCGYSAGGMLRPPANATNAVELAGGYAFTLALLPDGSVIAWGENRYGECDVPSNLTGVIGIAAGIYHSLALRANGTVVAWGNDDFGQSTVPQGLSNVIEIAAGLDHSLALLADGTVVAWGDDSDGQSTVPQGLANVEGIAAGYAHSLALLADGTVVAWGDDSDGQSTVPQGLANVEGIAAGDMFNLALLADGTVVAWGANWQGECSVPSGLESVVAISAGGSHSLALKADGSVVAWGSNWSGETSVPPGIAARSILAGPQYSMSLTSLNPLYLDTDGDGLCDGDELTMHGMAPVNWDTDWDGLSDYEEICTYGTDPDSHDTDGDGMSDGEEVQQSRNPLQHDVLLDPDGDSIPTIYEQNWGSNPNLAASIPPPQAFVYADSHSTNATENGSDEAPWTNLQHALDVAPDFGIVRIAPGTYTGSFSIHDYSSRRLIVEAWDANKPPYLYSNADDETPVLDVTGRDRLTLIRHLILRRDVPFGYPASVVKGGWEYNPSGPVLDRMVIFGNVIPSYSFLALIKAYESSVRIQNSLLVVPEQSTGLESFSSWLDPNNMPRAQIQVANNTFICADGAKAISLDVDSSITAHVTAAITDTVVVGAGSTALNAYSRVNVSLARCRFEGGIVAPFGDMTVDDVHFGSAQLNDFGVPMADSPCIDAAGPDSPLFDLSGYSRYDVPGVTNLHGTAADIGAIEYRGASADSDSDSLPDDWEVACFGNTNETAWADADLDGVPNALEWICGSDPNGWLRVRSSYDGEHVLTWNADQAGSFLVTVYTNDEWAAASQVSGASFVFSNQWAGLDCSAEVSGLLNGRGIWSRNVSWRQPQTNSYLTAWLIAPALPSGQAANASGIFHRQTIDIDCYGDWDKFFLGAAPDAIADWQLTGLDFEYAVEATAGARNQTNRPCHLPAAPAGANEMEVRLFKPTGVTSVGIDTPLYLLKWSPRALWVIPDVE